MKLRFLFILLTVILYSTSCLAGTMLYVNGTNGDDTWDGLAPVWDGTHGPKKTIQAGVDASTAGDTVNVADGTYTGTGNKNIDFIGKEITVRSQNGAENCIIDCQNSGRGFYFHTSETNASVVEGFTIKNGNVTGSDARGGGIYCTNSSPIIISCILKRNSAEDSGGGISAVASGIRIIDTIINENYSADGGGCTIFGTSVAVEGCTISGNYSHQIGGGIYIGASGTFTNNVIMGNYSGSGGGVYVYGSSIPYFTNCSIIENRAGSGGGVFSTVHSQFAMTNCKIMLNVAGSGGGAFHCSDDSAPVINKCEIYRNFSLGGASAIHCITGASPEIKNSIIAKNTTDGKNHGAFYFRESGLPKITNCVIVNNTGLDSIYVIGSHLNSIVTVKNCIIRSNNQNKVFTSQGGIADISYSNIEGGYSGDGNIDADPHFINPIAHDYHLAFNSPCIDSGTSDGVPATDRDGETRWDHPLVPNTGGGTIRYYDMGIYEFKDSDLDFLPDYWENLNALNPNDDGSINPDNGSDGDPDGDGLSNFDEYLNSSNPRHHDTDMDGRDDLSEVLLGTNPAHPDNVEKTYYVNYEIGDDGYDGLSATLNDIHGPKKTIQAGISAAADGWGYIVEVADGIYPVGGEKTLDYEGKAITLRSKNGAENTIIDCEMNGRALKFHSREGSDSVIDGFKIINGSKEMEDYYRFAAGGAICSIGCSPTIINCVILDCTSTYGGGIGCYYSKPLIEGCTIKGGQAVFGGGICMGSSIGTVNNCIIMNNHTTSANGGGVQIGNSYGFNKKYATVSNCKIKNNTAVYDGGGVSCQDSGNIINCVISGNSAYRGGGVYGRTMTIEGCEINSNSASAIGGGIYAYYLTDNLPSISNCTISDNFAGQDGGGIYSDEFDIENTIFKNNVAVNRGGGIYTLDGVLFNCLIIGNSANNGGGAFVQSGVFPTNCTFAENTSFMNGGGIETSSYGYVKGYHCIFWNNQPSELFCAPSSTLILLYSDVKGGWEGLGNINEDPLFVRGHLHNFYLSHIVAGQTMDSLCIDAGQKLSAELGLETFSTRTDFGSDVGMVDMGYHSPYALYAFSIVQVGSDIRIRWSSQDGISYVVEWSEDMSSWNQVSVGQVSEWTDINAGGYARKFYRVREE